MVHQAQQVLVDLVVHLALQVSVVIAVQQVSVVGAAPVVLPVFLLQSLNILLIQLQLLVIQVMVISYGTTQHKLVLHPLMLV